jgi:hypothetical protein
MQGRILELRSLAWSFQKIATKHNLSRSTVQRTIKQASEEEMDCGWNALPTLYTFAHEAYSFCISTLPFPGEGKIIHAGQHVRMVLSQLLLARLLHLYLQPFGRIRPALIAVS